MSDTFGRPWSEGSLTSTGGSADQLLGQDYGRGGLRIFPHPTVDIWVNAAGEDATGSIAAGDDKLPAGSTVPLEYLGADCPSNAVSVYTTSSISITYHTRPGGRG